MHVQIGFMGVLAALTFTACKIVRTTDYNKLVEDNLMMTESIFRSDSIQNCFMSAYAEIERNIDEIKIREKMIVQANEEGPIDQQQKILNDIAEIGKLMESNRKQLRQMQSLKKQLIDSKKQTARLQEENRRLLGDKNQAQEENRRLRDDNNRLKMSAQTAQAPQAQAQPQGGNPFAPSPAAQAQAPQAQGGQMDKQTAEKLAKAERAYQEMAAKNKQLEDLNKQMTDQIKGLQDKVTESEARIESLQEELALLKEAYAALQAINDSLQLEIQRYQREAEGKDAELANKDAELTDLRGKVSMAYYYVGTSKDIKTNAIFGKKNINPNVKMTVFTRIDDINELRQIETKSAKADVMSPHPTGSYTINNKNPKNLVVEIKDPEKFWSVTRFLVIQKK